MSNTGGVDKKSVADSEQIISEPLEFNVFLENLETEDEKYLVEEIKKVAEKHLYHWKSFPIALPEPVSINSFYENEYSNVENGKQSAEQLQLNQCFEAPVIEECDSIQFDESGRVLRLNNEQLRSIRKTGTFDVPSLHIPNSNYTWRLSCLLQQGTTITMNRFLNAIGRSISLILITTIQFLFSSSSFSTYEGLRSIIIGFLGFLDCLIGMPSIRVSAVNEQIQLKRCQYLIQDLTLQPGYTYNLDVLCAYLKSKIRDQWNNRNDLATPIQPNDVAHLVPYSFNTPTGAVIDLRLFCSSLIKKVEPILQNIVQQEKFVWVKEFREHFMQELKQQEQQKTNQEIIEMLQEAVRLEYLRRLYASISKDVRLEDLSPGLAQCIVQHGKAMDIMQSAVEQVQAKIQTCIENAEILLKKSHPILSRIDKWREWKMAKISAKIKAKCLYSAHAEALKICTTEENQQEQQQTIYFLRRDLEFLKEIIPQLRKQWRKDYEPSRIFEWNYYKWCPSSWIVKRRTINGGSETVPTVIVREIDWDEHSPTSIENNFYLDKHCTYRTTTSWPFWRIANLFHRTMTWLWSALYYFLIQIPWNSKFSLRAIFCIQPFSTGLDLSQRNGCLYPAIGNRTETVISRLRSFWEYLKQKQFEYNRTADRGFFNKNVYLFFHILWFYFIKGLLYMVFFLSFLMPVLNLIVVAISLCLALAAPLYIPIFALCYHIFLLLLYDCDSPNDKYNAWLLIFESLIWNITLAGICQTVLSISVALVYCPVAAIIILLYGLLRFIVRSLWDFHMYYLFIKTCGRVPAVDDFLAKRINGPGTGTLLYYLLKPEQALIAFEAELCSQSVDSYESSTRKEILKPKNRYEKFIRQCFGPFAANLDSSHEPFLTLDKKCLKLVDILTRKCRERKEKLKIMYLNRYLEKSRLKESDLKIVLEIASNTIKRYYPDNVIAKYHVSEDEFFMGLRLQPQDWNGLAKVLLKDIFGHTFLTPLPENYPCLKVAVNPSQNIESYTEIVEKVKQQHIEEETPSTSTAEDDKSLIIQMPAKSITNFVKRTYLAFSFEVTRKSHYRPWQRISDYIECDLLIPLPVLHPIYIALYIAKNMGKHSFDLSSTASYLALREVDKVQVFTPFVQPNPALNISTHSRDSSEIFAEGDAEPIEDVLARFQASIGYDLDNIGIDGDPDGDGLYTQVSIEDLR